MQRFSLRQVLNFGWGNGLGLKSQPCAGLFQMTGPGSDMMISPGPMVCFKVAVLILDGLLPGLQDVCAAFPDQRKSEGVYSMADIGLSAFSLFFMPSKSFLAYQRSLEEGRKTSNCQSLFGMAEIPIDNHIRGRLDPVPPALLQPVFDQGIAALHEHAALRAFELSKAGSTPS